MKEITTIIKEIADRGTPKINSLSQDELNTLRKINISIEYNAQDWLCISGAILAFARAIEMQSTDPDKHKANEYHATVLSIISSKLRKELIKNGININGSMDGDYHI